MKTRNFTALPTYSYNYSLTTRQNSNTYHSLDHKIQKVPKKENDKMFEFNFNKFCTEEIMLHHNPICMCIENEARFLRFKIY